MFEWIKRENVVGKNCGQVDDPHGRDVGVDWADGIVEYISRTAVRIAPSPGARFGDFTLIGYIEDGVEVLQQGCSHWRCLYIARHSFSCILATTDADNILPGTTIELVDRDAFEEHLKLAARAVHLRENAKELDATEFADSDTCAYEQAAIAQTHAHQKYMMAIGLKTLPTGPTTKKNKKKKAPTEKTRDPPRRSTRETPATKGPWCDLRLLTVVALS